MEFPLVSKESTRVMRKIMSQLKFSAMSLALAWLYFGACMGYNAFDITARVVRRCPCCVICAREALNAVNMIPSDDASSFRNCDVIGLNN